MNVSVGENTITRYQISPLAAGNDLKMRQRKYKINKRSNHDCGLRLCLRS